MSDISLSKKRCNDPYEHEGHRWVTVEDAECSGRADCGDMNHPSHTYKKTVEVWCVGELI